MIGENPEWNLHITHALWVYRTTSKIIHDKTPFMLVYRKDTFMPTDLEIATYYLAFQTKELDNSLIFQRFNTIFSLEEER